MFTVNITRFIAEECMRDYSASVAELGPNAGRYTWEACTENAPEWNFIPADQLDYFREWLREWGAWDADEIAAMDVAHLQSMCLQWIAGDVRSVPNEKERLPRMAHCQNPRTEPVCLQCAYRIV